MSGGAKAEKLYGLFALSKGQVGMALCARFYITLQRWQSLSLVTTKWYYIWIVSHTLAISITALIHVIKYHLEEVQLKLLTTIMH